MAKLTPEELIEAFKEMTLIEASEFRKLFEETFDVTAAAPVAVAAPGAAGLAGHHEHEKGPGVGGQPQGAGRHHDGPAHRCHRAASADRHDPPADQATRPGDGETRHRGRPGRRPHLRHLSTPGSRRPLHPVTTGSAE